MRRLTSVIVVLAIALAGVRTHAGQERPRQPSGTAVVAGRVTTDDAMPSPVRRASVMLVPAEGTADGMTLVTEDDGSFRFEGVAPGRYQLAAHKPGYLRASYGATRPERPGTPIAIAAGATRTDFTLRLTKGAVITGRVTDAQGDPASSTAVEVHRVTTVAGRRVFDTRESVNTDDRGVYRVFGLPPGDYAVTAVPDGSHGNDASIAVTGPQDVQWAERAVRSGQGADAPPASAQVGYAPVFYPGSTHGDQAQVVTLAAGAERNGVDFALQLVPMARLEGKIVGTDGLPAEAHVFVMPEGDTALPGLQGMHETMGSEFSFRGMTPGTYTVMARSHDEEPTSSRGPLWGMTTVTMGTADLRDVTITLQPALKITGRLIFDATVRKPPDPAGSTVHLLPVTSDERRLLFSGDAEVQSDGRFTVTNLMPGRYQLLAGLGHDPSGGWSVRSVTFGGRQVTDQAFDVQPDRAASELVVTLTDRVTSLRGSLVNAENRPAPDFYVIAFPADRAYWLPRSLRIRSTRPATDGTFSFASLPPGDYLIAALTDVEGEEWREPSFLEQLVSSAITLRVVEGTTTVQNIRIK